jgi:hypothetical protein
METPLRTDITPSIHPGIVDEAHGKVLGGDSRLHANHALAAGREALEVAYSAVGSLLDAAKAHQSNFRVERHKGRTVKALERSDELRKAAEASFGRAAAQVDRRTREINAAREKLAAEVDEALRPPSRDNLAATMASEIRSHFESIKGGERLRLFHRAVDAKDRATIAAVLHAPAYLSGMDDAQQSELRSVAAAALAPEAAAEVTEIDKVLDRVRLAGKTLTDRYGEILDRLRRPGDEERERSVRALAKG